MYENKTFESILASALSRIPASLDKREGAIIYDAIAPCCAELAQAYIDLDNILTLTYADDSYGIYLEKRTKEHGIEREGATHAICKGEFTPLSTVSVGDRFNCDKFNYVITEIKDTYCELMCETTGTETNSIMGDLIPIEYINGLQTAKLTEILKPAEDAETDERLRARFFESLRSKAFGGNIADYKQKVKAIEGVGSVKVTPVWNGGGTVKLTLLASDYSVPTEYLVETVQDIIDPSGDATGVGEAPIGHIVTVEGATSLDIDIETTITYATGWTYETAKEYIENALDTYYLELRREWENNETLVVRVSQVETRLLACEGILDIADTTINGEAHNKELTKYQVPVRGTFNE